MSIELRSTLGLTNTLQVLRSGDYDGETSLNILLHDRFFSSSLGNSDFTILHQLMAEVGSLPNLESLTIRPIVLGKIWKCCFPVEAVACAIHLTSQLRQLTVLAVILVGERKEFDNLAHALKCLLLLKDATLGCGARERADGLGGSHLAEEQFGNGPLTSLLDPVLSALGQIKSLETFSVEDVCAIVENLCLSKDTLARICSLPKIRVLALYGFSISNEDLIVMSQHLKRKTFLTGLHIECSDLNEDGSNAWKSMINKIENICLLEIHCRSFEDNVKGLQLLGGIMKEIKRDKCTELVIKVPSWSIQAVISSAREMLRNNYMLERFSLFQRSNEFPFIYFTRIQDEEIDFLLATNKLGRRKLFQNDSGEQETKDLWMSMFDATENDLSKIYYLVRSHPNEFAQMLLDDYSEKMMPTTRVIRALLRENIKSMERKMDRGLKANTVALDEAVDMLLMSNLVQQKSLEKAMQDDKEELSGNIESLREVMRQNKEELSATMQQCKEDLFATLREELSANTGTLQETIRQQEESLTSKTDSLQEAMQGDTKEIATGVKTLSRDNARLFELVSILIVLVAILIAVVILLILVQLSSPHIHTH